MIIFIPFDRQLDRSEFECGEPELDSWLQQHAGQSERRNTTRTFFGVDERETRIASYYCTVTHRIELDELALTQFSGRRYPISAVLLARLAVDSRYQGTGLGRITLFEALSQLSRASTSIGFEVVTVDAISPDATAFYLRHGFEQLSDDGRRLFMSTKDLRATFAEAEADSH